MATSANHNVYDGVPFDNRYRVAYQQYLQFGPDFSSTADLNLWSDPWITRDYFPSEYQQENQPPNFVSLNQYNPNFTISLLASPQVNPFFETVERLPEFSVETKQQKIFGSPIEYTSQSSVVNFQRKYADTDLLPRPGRLSVFNSFPNNCRRPPPINFYHPKPDSRLQRGPAEQLQRLPLRHLPRVRLPAPVLQFPLAHAAHRRPLHLLFRRQPRTSPTRPTTTA